MRLELSPPVALELEVLVPDDDADEIVEVPAVEGVDEVEDDDVVEVAELLDVLVLQESAIALEEDKRRVRYESNGHWQQATDLDVQQS